METSGSECSNISNCGADDMVRQSDTEFGLSRESTERKKYDPSKDSTEPRVTVDAVHPRFLKKPKQNEVSVATSTDNFYCRQCDKVFEPSIAAAKQHFVSISHCPKAPCVYCSGPVYEYVFKDEVKFLHECTDDFN